MSNTTTQHTTQRQQDLAPRPSTIVRTYASVRVDMNLQSIEVDTVQEAEPRAKKLDPDRERSINDETDKRKEQEIERTSSSPDSSSPSVH